MISSVLVAQMGPQSMHISIPIMCKTIRGDKTVDTQILLNSGAGGIFMHPSFAKKHDITLHPLKTPILPKNVDGTINRAGKITHFTWIQTKIDGQTDLVRVLITNIGTQDLLFGLPWLTDINPQIQWSTGTITLKNATQETVQEYFKKDRIQ